MAVSGKLLQGRGCDHVPGVNMRAERAVVCQCSDVPPLDSTANGSPIIHSSYLAILEIPPPRLYLE